MYKLQMNSANKEYINLIYSVLFWVLVLIIFKLILYWKGQKEKNYIILPVSEFRV